MSAAAAASTAVLPRSASAMAAPRMLGGHEAEIIIPGSFVVLQGTAGDGVANTMNVPPPPLEYDTDFLFPSEDEEDDFMDAESSAGSSDNSESLSVTMVETSSSAPTATTRGTMVTTTTRALAPTVARNTATLGSLTGGMVGTLLPQRRPAAAAAAAQTSSSSLSCEGADSFVVVTDHEDDAQDEPQQQHEPSRKTAVAKKRCPSQATAATVSSGTCRSNPSSSRPSSQQQQLPLHAQEALEEWNQSCRQREQLKRTEWRESAAQVSTSNLDHIFIRRAQDFWWLTDKGRIAILRDLPTQLGNGKVLKSVIGSLAPGSTVVATDIVYLDSKTLQRIQVPPVSASGGSTVPHRIYPRAKQGWICLVKVDGSSSSSGQQRSGYVTLNLDGYPLLAPGLPPLYTDPNCWIWRVTCPAGAFVREGLDLNSHHIETLPYGSLVRVTRRTVNSQGLCRLRVSAIVEDYSTSPMTTTTTSAAATTASSTASPMSRRRPSSSSSSSSSPSTQQQPSYSTPRIIDGWCSEFLNPLSGNRGTVLEPLSFPVPAIYKVTIPIGAVIRSDIELSTPQLGTLSQGSTAKVVGRAYSEHPVECCLERVQLAGGDAGWISVRLNRPPPHDEVIVELVDTDSTFDPEMPGLYHWKQMQQPDDDVRELSSVDSDAVSSNHSDNAAVNKRSSPMGSPRTNVSKCNPPSNNAFCLICLNEERNATIVHGETGHVACCLMCARILKARGDKCPVCRLQIDLVIQHFWA